MQFRLSPERSEQIRRLTRTVAREPFQRRAWAELGYFLVSSALAGLAVAVTVAIGALGLGLSAALLGILILAGGMRASRGLGRWNRTLAFRVLGEDIGDPEPFGARPGLFGWLRSALGDRAAWRALAYFLAKIPLTLFGIWFALSIWIEAVFGVLSPMTGRPGGIGFGPFGGLFEHGTYPYAGPVNRVGIFVAGAVLLFIAPWAMRVVVGIDVRMMRVLLGPGASASRLRTLEESRSKTLDAATETLRRIERNLHDGTQAQLVALAMRLGQAKEKLNQMPAPDVHELDSVRRLIDEAHRGAKEAITDLRDLARGIHPPALDTGLENALATLAARSAVPTEVTVLIPVRPSPAMEAIAYFCAAELLSNVAQHADASRASLTCAQHGPWLRIVVRDNGCGGATVAKVGSSSSGLVGLAERVETVYGRVLRGAPTRSARSAPANAKSWLSWPKVVRTRPSPPDW